MPGEKQVASSTESLIPTAEAVVIGCSCENVRCDQHMHPSSENFFSIDINPSISPDLCMDIAQDEIPSNLSGRFKLTVLEYLPRDAYNDDCYGSGGAKGMINARRMTDENGFIMIVGNTREMQSRKSLADLNYLEIGGTGYGNYVVLIPNNQGLTAEETSNQIKTLPKPLQDSITAAISTSDYRPTNTTEFCKLNYHTSAKNEDFIKELDIYLTVRMFQDRYKTKFSIAGREFTFGFSREQKISAAETLVSVLLGNLPVENLQDYNRELSNGELGRIVSKHLDRRSLQDLIDHDRVVASSDVLDHYKTSLGNIKSQQSELSSNSVEDDTDDISPNKV